MESGSLKVLKLIQKGIKPEDIETGGRRIMAAGISLSEYIMPGVGGRALSREHAIETARVLNRIRPDFIRVRTFAIHPMSPIQKMVEDGEFDPMTDAKIVAEIRSLLEHLDEIRSLEDHEPDGFNKHIRHLMSYQLPQPQTDCWG